MNVIELVNLEKVYHEDMPDIAVHAVNKLNLAISHGEAVGIVGPSGCGKSTLMQLIGCLDRPTRGSYLLEDQDVARFGDNELAKVRNKRIGFVFQTFNLLARYTALENVMLPLKYSNDPDPRAKALTALERVGLSNRAHHLPTELSGGQKQRVAIARALVNTPAILLADEPTGALDSRTGSEILDLLLELNSHGSTLIIVTHDLGVARRMKRVVKLRDGRVEADGSPEAVLGAVDTH
ncbi:MAG: ABC transporter ATP-binding protein [Planctomycetes bacterium]|nr:ABC transporter ATP-binding protein [Planctomycetota bacterium]CAG1010897.1 sulfonate transport system ATP-binding protein [Phycisphaerales bacterium]